MHLAQSVIDRVTQLGEKDASAFFGVTVSTVTGWVTGRVKIPAAAAQKIMDEMSTSPMPSPLTMWEGRKVAMLMPVYRSLNPDTHFTLFANYARYGPEKIAMLRPLKMTTIWEARNILIHQALKELPDADTYIMPDDDMILPFGYPDHFRSFYDPKMSPALAGVVAFSRLLSHPDEMGIVGALYFGRHGKGRAQCDLGFYGPPGSNDKLRKGTITGVQSMKWVGTGLIRIKRWVIEKLKAEIENGRWPECKAASEQNWHGYFSPERVGVGEDVSFGHRCHEIGINSYLDTGLVCLHMGEQPYGPSNTSD